MNESVQVMYINCYFMREFINSLAVYIDSLSRRHMLWNFLGCCCYCCCCCYTTDHHDSKTSHGYLCHIRPLRVHVTLCDSTVLPSRVTVNINPILRLSTCNSSKFENPQIRWCTFPSWALCEFWPLAATCFLRYSLPWASIIGWTGGHVPPTF